MQVTLIPSAVQESEREQFQLLSSFLINDTLAIDAGSIGLYRTPEEQTRIRHLLLSHSHMDHLASLPVFLENIFDGGGSPVTIHGTPAVLECLQQDLFNERIWPDFIGLSRGEKKFLQLAALEPGRPVQLEGLRITPVEVNHVVPTVGFVIEEGAAAVVLSSDTGPTQALWDHANRTANLKGVFLEATFPNEMAGLAEIARHLTPATFALEVRKLRQAVPIIALHLKPRFRAQIIEQLHALGLPQLEIARYGRPYPF